MPWPKKKPTAADPAQPAPSRRQRIMSKVNEGVAEARKRRKK